MEKQAFIVRCSPNGINRVDELRDKNQIAIGWSHTRDTLFDTSLNREQFKQKLKEIYGYENRANSLGKATGFMWKFIREMKLGDYVLVPIPRAFYLGEITSDVLYLPEKVEEDTAIRRSVNWLNNGQSIARTYCSAGLTSRLKFQGTLVGANDLVQNIEFALKLAIENIQPTFKEQLNDKLKEEVKKLLVSNDSFLNDRSFEQLIKQLMLALGATTCEIPSKTKYKNSIADVDVIAEFVHLGLRIFIQVKKHRNHSDSYAVDQIIKAIELDSAENTTPIFGWVVTSSVFSTEAENLANANAIRLINNDELSEMMISVGLDKFNL